MNNIGDLLKDADPLRREKAVNANQRNACFQIVLAATSQAGASVPTPSRSRVPVLSAAALILLIASFLGLHDWPSLVGELHAAVRFEIRLAETEPAPGLRPAKIVSLVDRFTFMIGQL